MGGMKQELERKAESYYQELESGIGEGMVLTDALI
jgi:hypothetical protein